MIATMLQETVKLTARSSANEDSAERLKAALAQGSYLKQLGVNYRWSAVVRDERAPWAAGADEERDPYGLLSGELVRAGDRAPDAPGLVGVVDGRETTLFGVFKPTRHTGLVFGGDAGRAEAVVKALGRYPQGLVASVVVLPSDGEPTKVEGADMVLRDRDGVAYRAYGMADGPAYTVIVRPDGVIGAIVAGEEGVAKYFGNILSSA